MFGDGPGTYMAPGSRNDQKLNFKLTPHSRGRAYWASAKTKNIKEIVGRHEIALIGEVGAKTARPPIYHQHYRR